MIIPKNKNKLRKLFIELNYLEKTGFKEIRRFFTKTYIKRMIYSSGLLLHSPSKIEKKIAFYCVLADYSQCIDYLLEQLRKRHFEGNGEYPHPAVLTPEERKDLWLATLPEEIRLDLSSVSDDDIPECLRDKMWDGCGLPAHLNKDY